MITHTAPKGAVGMLYAYVRFMKTVNVTDQTSGQLLRIIKNAGVPDSKINEIVRLPEVDARATLEDLARVVMGKKVRQ